MYYLNPHAFPSIICAFFLLGLGVLAFLKNRRSAVNRVFFFLTFSCFIWQITNFFFLSSISFETALFWSRLMYAGVFFIPISFYHLSVLSTGFKKQLKFVILSYIIAIFVFLPLDRLGYLFHGFKEHFWGKWMLPGPVHPFFLAFFAILFLTGLLNLYLGYKKESVPVEINRKKYLFLSFLIASFGSVDYLAIYNIEVYPFGYLPVVICLSVITYAIIKYRLMNVSIAITFTGIFIALYTLVLGLPFVLVTFGKPQMISLFGQNWWAGPLTLMAVLAIVGPFIYIFLQKRAEGIILREQLTYQRILKQAARELTRIHNLKRLLDLIVHIVTKTVRIFHSAIYLYDEHSEQFILKAYRHCETEPITAISKTNKLIDWLETQKESLIYEEIHRKSEDSSGYVFLELEQQMRFLNASVIVPGFLKDRLLGFLVLGDKRSKGFYTQEDLDTFSVLANQAALAIENASLYENIEEQVRQRTRELVEVQKQLVQAEKLATVGTLAGGVAHEINNPLTAILTNAQMLLTSDDIRNAQDKESLQLIEEATQRCRNIVKKMMTYARKPLETAEISEVDLTDVVAKAVSFLGYQMEQENIKIVTQTKEDTYLIMGNHNELEQVATNLLLNARDAIKRIKKSGTIHISLSKNSKWIKVQIKDEGAGMTKEVISRIFDPFFTTKEVGKGLGLGLPICQAIVERHNGMITLESEPNKGSIFTVQFPKAKQKVKVKSGANL